jgi:hypothetical protein
MYTSLTKGIVIVMFAMGMLTVSWAAGGLSTEGRCAAGDGPCETGGVHGLPSTKRDTVLMQVNSPKLALAEADAQKIDEVRANALAKAVLSDTVVASYIRAFNQDPLKVASVIQCGLQAILGALPHFLGSPSNVFEGLKQLGMGLFDCIKGLLSPLLKNSPLADEDLEGEWGGAFDIIASVESIVADVKKFIATGDPPPLIQAIASILGEAGSLISSFLPEETGTELRKYLSAVSEAFEAVGSSWDEFARGRTAEGIETLYLGLKGIADDLIPDAWKNNTVYVVVATTLDTVLGNLSQHVFEYERQLMESTVCWRTEQHRERMRPEVCPEGWTAGGDAFCYQLVSLQQHETSGQLDKTVQSKGGDRPRGAIPARCDRSSRYSEKHSHFCYSACGSGFEPKSHAKCISKCEGKFPAETPGMCGQNKGLAIKAIMEMVTVVTNSGFSLADNIIKMKGHGVDATTLSSTVQVFIDMGKPFANPICPVPSTTDETSSPTAIAGPSPTTSPSQNERGASQQVLPKASPICSMGQSLLISSHRGEQLQDNHGTARFSRNTDEWERWELSDAGKGKVFITSHRGAQLADHHGDIAMSWNKRDWEKWNLLIAGSGKVYITSHQRMYLQDNADKAMLSSEAGAWEAFAITDTSGANVCAVAPES